MDLKPERRRVALSGRDCELALVDWGGTGPVLLLAHANGFCADVLGPFARLLTSEFHVIGYDARGHGDSDAPKAHGAYQWSELIADQVALIEQIQLELGLDRLDRGVGHSMGASVMLAVAARHPDLFGSIDLIDPIIALPPSQRTGYYAGEGEHPMAERARKRRRRFESRAALRAKWEQRNVYADWDRQALIELLDHAFRDSPKGGIELKCDPDVEALIYEGGRDLEFFAEVGSLTVPARLFHSERGFVPRAVAEQLVASSQFLHLERLELGHFAPMESPSEMASMILHESAGILPPPD
jgi:pimeloyl-ACP methyl ester carboxylesterase